MVHLTSPRALYADVVFLEVGPEKERMSVHKGILMQQSEFFRAAFEGKFSESASGVIVLSEDTPWVVHAFVTWLYGPCLEDADGKELALSGLLELYAFADSKLVRNLETKIHVKIDALANSHGSDLPAPASIAYVYAHLPDTSPIRALLVKWICQRLQGKENAGTWLRALLAGGCPQDFLVDMAARSLRLGPLQAGSTRQPPVAVPP